MKVTSFLGKTLDDDVINLIVEKLSFENMKKDSQFVSEGQWRHLVEDSYALLRISWVFFEGKARVKGPRHQIYQIGVAPETLDICISF